MENKADLIENVKQWISLDNEIISIKSKLKELDKKKKSITAKLTDVMKTNEIDCFDINEGKLMFKQTKTKKPINAKMLQIALQKFYNDDSEKADELKTFLLNSRHEEIKESIKRKINK